MLPSLARLLGKAFFKAKKQPVPVDLRGKDWRAPVSAAVRATYYFRGGGSCVNVRVARSSFTPAQVAENVEAALAGLVPRLAPPGATGRWAGVRSVLIKSAASAALPVYQAEPRGVEEDESEEENDKEEEQEAKKRAPVVGKKEVATTAAAAAAGKKEKGSKKKKTAPSALEGAAPKKKKTAKA